MLLDMRILSHSDIMMLCGKNPDCQKLIVKEDLDEMKDYMISVDVPAFASEETDEKLSHQPWSLRNMPVLPIVRGEKR